MKFRLQTFIIVCGIVCIVCAVFYYKKFISEIPLYNIESQIAFLQQPKHIAQKDFLEAFNNNYIWPNTNNNQEVIIQPSVATITKESLGELPLPELRALINQHALIDTTWLQLHDTFLYNNEKYVLQEIFKDTVKLQHTTQKDRILVLKIFPLHQEILVEMLE